MQKVRIILWSVLILFVMTGCSSEKFLSGNQRVLTSVKLTSSDKSVDISSFKSYVRQEPNSRWFNLLKVPLGIYCMSGTDTTKSFNRFLQRVGEAPVVYDGQLTQATNNQLKLALQSKGFLHANVETSVKKSGHKTHLCYLLKPGQQYSIRSIDYDIDDREIDSILKKNESESLLSVNMPCDANLLDEERDRIITVLHNNGYYKALKKFVFYDIDTIAGPRNLALTLHYNAKTLSTNPESDYTRYWIGNISVSIIDDENILDQPYDSIKYRGVKIRYKGPRTIRPNVIYSQLDIQRGAYYNEESVRRTYNNFSRLKILRATSIHFNDTGAGSLDCEVLLRTDKQNQISAEIEGTNTSGDLGIASSVSFTNKNLFHGSEVWTTKVKGAYEAITGLEGYSDHNFFELSLESRLSFPRIIIPFMPEHRRVNMHGSSEFVLQYNTQDRPEFHRRFLTALWSYKWSGGENRFQHKLDAIGLNYVFMPWISSTFRKEYLDNDNARFAIVRYTYEDLLILNSSYNFIYNSKGNHHNIKENKNSSQFHVGVESAGNLLYMLSGVFNVGKDEENRYRLFNVAFAQYLKFDIDYARSIYINKNNTLAMRGALGIVFPYGNNTVVPYEKRYFAGGANSIRGWSVRELGPGSFVGKDGKIDFINQTGNLKLLFNIELRSYLFWKLSGALFVDAGNIWTTRNYDAQPGGQFLFESFYKQIAASYGWGLRLNLDYFILRFDMGMKAVSPYYSNTHEHYPLLHPNFRRDFTFHFAVGLPF